METLAEKNTPPVKRREARKGIGKDLCAIKVRRNCHDLFRSQGAARCEPGAGGGGRSRIEKNREAANKEGIGDKTVHGWMETVKTKYISRTHSRGGNFRERGTTPTSGEAGITRKKGKDKIPNSPSHDQTEKKGCARWGRYDQCAKD